MDKKEVVFLISIYGCENKPLVELSRNGGLGGFRLRSTSRKNQNS